MSNNSMFGDVVDDPKPKRPKRERQKPKSKFHLPRKATPNPGESESGPKFSVPKKNLKPKKKTANKAKVYSYFAREIFEPGEVKPASRYTLRTFQAIEKRNIAAIVSLKRKDTIMHDIEEMLANLEFATDDIDINDNDSGEAVVYV